MVLATTVSSLVHHQGWTERFSRCVQRERTVSVERGKESGDALLLTCEAELDHGRAKLGPVDGAAVVVVNVPKEVEDPREVGLERGEARKDVRRRGWSEE